MWEKPERGSRETKGAPYLKIRVTLQGLVGARLLGMPCTEQRIGRGERTFMGKKGGMNEIPSQPGI